MLTRLSPLLFKAAKTENPLPFSQAGASKAQPMPRPPFHVKTNILPFNQAIFKNWTPRIKQSVLKISPE
jgi:hypothetical protein